MEEPRTYNRSQTLQTITDLYTFLSQTTPYIPTSDILQPPPNGWPLSHELLSYKTDEVHHLLTHLPYVKQDRAHWSHPRYMLRPYTAFCDYRQDLGEAHLKALLTANGMLPAHVLPLAEPTEGRYGAHVVLDTTDGTVTEIGSGSGGDGEVGRYSEGDHRAWRNRALHKWDPLEVTLPIEVYVGRIVERFRKLEYIPRPGMGDPGIYDVVGMEESDEEFLEAKELQAIYCRHGWADLKNFRRDACWRDLEHWLEEKDAAKTRRLMNAPPILPGAAVTRQS